jgi:hypothetical protein
MLADVAERTVLIGQFREAMAALDAHVISVGSDPADDDASRERSRLEKDLGERMEAMQLAGFSDEDIVYSANAELESRQQKDDVEKAQASTDVIDVAATAPPPPPPPPAPLPPGTTEWGKWKHGETEIYLEVLLHDGERAKEMNVRVEELTVQSDGKGTLTRSLVVGPEAEPVLVGALAQPVRPDELVWAVEERAEGRVLEVELPKKFNVNSYAFNTLCIRGEECAHPGLTQPPEGVDGDFDDETKRKRREKEELALAAWQALVDSGEAKDIYEAQDILADKAISAALEKRGMKNQEGAPSEPFPWKKKAS